MNRHGREGHLPRFTVPFPTHTVGAALVVAAAAAGLSACGSSSSNVSTTVPTSHTLNLAFLQDPGQPPDPAVYCAGQGLILQDNIYDGLVQYAPNTADRNIVPDLATSWTVSDLRK